MPLQLAPGFLVAAPSLTDPHFKRSVVLMVDHREEGSLGFVISRASDVKLAAIATGQSIDPQDVKSDVPVLVGGPVAPETGWIVLDPRDLTDLPEGTLHVSESVAVSTSRALLEKLIRGQVVARHMLVLGYAGWGAGQLDEELERGAWIPVELTESVVFDAPLDRRWGEALRSAGIDPGRLSVQAPSEA